MPKFRLLKGGNQKPRRTRAKRRRCIRLGHRIDGKGRANVGALVRTAGATQAEIRTVHAKVKLLDSRIMDAKGPASMAMREEFLSFYTEWLRWREDHTTWIDKLGVWSATWDKLMEYKKRVNAWVSRAAKLGVLSETEALPVDKPIPWSGIVWAIALLAGLAIVSKVKG